MISRLGLAISRIFHRTCPDPFVIAILLTVLTAILALAFGTYPPDRASIGARTTYLLDQWRGDTGFWKLLAFGMQMSLILVTGSALATTRPVRALIQRLASLPTSTASGAVLVCIAACLTGLVNWGLGLIAGAMLARDVSRSLASRGIPVHRPLLAAAGYMGLLVFHGGLSGSAPLSSTTLEGARKVLPEVAIKFLGDGIGLDRTLLSPLNLFVTGGLVLLLPIAFWLLAPKRADLHAINTTSFGDQSEAPLPCEPPAPVHPTLPDRLDRSPIVVWLLALPLIAGLIRYGGTSGLLSLQINEINAGMLALGLILHGSPRAYMSAAENAARDCGAVIVQFPIYAGIMALMHASGLVQSIAEGFTAVASPETLPVKSFLAATLVGIFVPSGGGQWGVQGPVALQSGADAGVEPGTMVMTIAYGDELANMLQPFWALPLLAITGVKAREIVGYTAIIMVIAGAWMALGLILF